MVDIPNELKQQLFEQFFYPLISNPEMLTNEQIAWFREKSRAVWILDFNQDDFRKMKIVYDICMDLANEKELLECFLKPYFLYYSIENEKIPYPQFEEEDKENKVGYAHKLNNMYKSCFETGLRFYYSIFYLYGKMQEGNVSEIQSLLNISASTKFHYIKDTLIQGENLKYDIKDFLNDFDNNLRNQGGGHEQFFLDDNDNVVYKKTDDKTGREKRIYSIYLDDLEEHLKNIHRHFLIVDIAVALYLVNSGIKIGGDRSEPFLQREIAGWIEKNARLFGMDVVIDFFENGDVEMTVEEYKTKELIGIGISEMFSPTYHYYLVPIKKRVEWKEQLCWLIYNVGKFFSPEDMKNQILHIKISKEVDPTTIEINKDEILKMVELSQEGQKYFPELNKGEFPVGGFDLCHRERIEDDGSFTKEELEDAYKRRFGAFPE